MKNMQGDQERQRAIEILCEEWRKATQNTPAGSVPGVASKDVYDRHVAEEIQPGPGDMDALLTLLESEGHIHTIGTVSGREMYGGKWIDNVSDELLRNY